MGLPPRPRPSLLPTMFPKEQPAPAQLPSWQPGSPSSLGQPSGECRGLQGWSCSPP